MNKKELKQLRQAVAEYIVSEGCGCCEDGDTHRKAGDLLGKLLKVPKYKDGSGYDFYKFRAKL